jgi:2-polyprenyl-6-methoxyphenol hydroxylase-like FAD-dependent oxidoreductase
VVEQLRVVIVGAGIGGLTAAAALGRDGHAVQIIERARALEEVGAGLGLWPNALRALEELQLGQQVRAIGAVFAAPRVQDLHGRRLSRLDPERVVKRLGRDPMIVHRGQLQSVLRKAAERFPLRLGVAVERVDVTDPRSPVVVLADGESLAADLVIGADGVRSVVRSAIHDATPPRTGDLAWRAVLDSRVEVDDACLSIGRGHQFLATPMTHGRVYLAGLIGAFAGTCRESVETLREIYDGWHSPIPRWLNELADGDIHWDAVLHRPPPKTLHAGRVLLIGDAAHPMTPDLGQGGCQAIEDAVVLAAALRSQDAGVDAALNRFSHARRRRVRLIVHESYLTGRVLAAHNRAIAAGRNLLMRLAPPAIALAELARHSSAASFERSLKAVARPT